MMPCLTKTETELAKKRAKTTSSLLLDVVMAPVTRLNEVDLARIWSNPIDRQEPSNVTKEQLPIDDKSEVDIDKGYDLCSQVLLTQQTVFFNSIKSE